VRLLLVSVADPWHLGVDPDPDPDSDPDPLIYFIDVQKANTKT
jgi:hypothetical protein